MQNTRVGWDGIKVIGYHHTIVGKPECLIGKTLLTHLASAIKCADKVTTVSWSYFEELRYAANGLEALFEYEKGKCVGILNGIDTEVWNPATDTYIDNHFSTNNVTEGKLANKKILCDRFNLDIENPLIVFIGRLVGEKAADILPDSIMSCYVLYAGQS